MLSPAYMSIYQQYKADTDSVATWLATTAKAHGYGTEDAAAIQQAATQEAAKKKKKKKNNGKGKGPGHAKILKQRPTTSMPQSSSGKYIIKVKDFEAMAKYVADTNGIEVPHRTAIALERGI